MNIFGYEIAIKKVAAPIAQSLIESPAFVTSVMERVRDRVIARVVHLYMQRHGNELLSIVAADLAPEIVKRIELLAGEEFVQDTVARVLMGMKVRIDTLEMRDKFDYEAGVAADSDTTGRMFHPGETTNGNEEPEL